LLLVSKPHAHATVDALRQELLKIWRTKSSITLRRSELALSRLSGRICAERPELRPDVNALGQEKVNLIAIAQVLRKPTSRLSG